jgi:coenzyme PQQ synthesis protein D (PqqD)
MTMDCPNKSRGLVVEDMDGEILLYRPSTHQAIHLNGTAAVIWRLCDGTRTVNDLVQCLGDQYPAAKAAIALEVRQAIDLLLREGALEGPRQLDG